MPAALRWVLAATFILATGLLFYSFSTATADAFYREGAYPLELLGPQLMVRRPAPEFSLPDRTGRRHDLTSYRGRPLVLNLWSTDCPPCREELPSLIRLDQIGRHRGTFAVVTISVDDNWEAVSPLFQSEGEPPELVVLFDPSREVVEGRYETRRFPETFLIDAGGDIRARFDGQRNWASPVVLNVLESF